MPSGGFIQRKQVDKAVLFHDPLKKLKLKPLTPDGVIDKDNVKTVTLLLYYVIYIYIYIYVTYFNKCSDLRNLVNR